MINDDLAGELSRRIPEGGRLSLIQGVLEAWDPSTGDNQVRVNGGVLANVRFLVAETAALVVGDTISLIGAGSNWQIMGKVKTPGDPGTVPTWTPDIQQLTSVTIPAVQTMAESAQTDASAAVVTADAAQVTADDAAAAVAVVEGKFPITATDISDGAIETPKLAADAIDGMVVTGAWIRTGVDPDARIGLNDPDYPNQIVVYSGNAAEVTPGRIRPASGGAADGKMEMRSPSLVPGDTGYAFLTLEGQSDGTTSADLQAENVEVIGSDVTVMSTDGNLRLGDGTDYVTINGQAVSDADLSDPSNTFSFPQPVTVNELTLLNPVSNTTYAAGSPVCGTTFVAPPTGKVYVTVSGEIRGSASNSFARLSFEIRAGGSVGAGTVHTAAADNRAIIGGQFGVAITDFRHGGSRECLITGLTPGATYNVRTMHVLNAGSGAVYGRELLIKPVL